MLDQVLSVELTPNVPKDVELDVIPALQHVSACAHSVSLGCLLLRLVVRAPCVAHWLFVANSRHSARGEAGTSSGAGGADEGMVRRAQEGIPSSVVAHVLDPVHTPEC